MAKNINQPPKYCKDAIATKLGWKHPKTGELLVSNKSLDLEEIEKNFKGQVSHPPVKESIEERNQAEMDALMDLEDEELLSLEPDVSADVENDEIDETIDESTETVENDEIVIDADVDLEDIETIEITDIEDVKPSDVEPIVVADIIDYEEMTKAQLITYAKDTFDVVLSKKDNKTILINKITELNE